MSLAATTDYIAAIKRLSPGLALRAGGVSWDEYEQLLADLNESFAGKVFYHHGNLEIMPPPTKDHEIPRPIIYRLLIILSEELDIEISSVGTTTLKRRLRESGAEPDDAYYIRDIRPVLEAGGLDLECVPPPDLVLEIDYTSSSLDKFPIYAALGVPEIWRVTGGALVIYALAETEYLAVEHSRAFPLLSATTLTEFLNIGLREGETKAARAFRAWLRVNLPA